MLLIQHCPLSGGEAQASLSEENTVAGVALSLAFFQLWCVDTQLLESRDCVLRTAAVLGF